MPHVNLLGIDLVVSAFILHPTEPRCLLVKHRKLGGWFPVGGHVGDTNPYEDTDEALFKEVREESGLEVAIIDPPWSPMLSGSMGPGPHNRKQMHVPWDVEVHDFPLPGHQDTGKHKHLALVYVARAKSSQPRLAEQEHSGVRWFSKEDLELPEYSKDIIPSVKSYVAAVIDLTRKGCVAEVSGPPGRPAKIPVSRSARHDVVGRRLDMGGMALMSALAAGLSSCLALSASSVLGSMMFGACACVVSVVTALSIGALLDTTERGARWLHRLFGR